MNTTFNQHSLSWLLVSIILLALPAFASGESLAPSADEWSPVEQALEQGADAEALDLLDRIISNYPEWDYGHLRRAETLERHGHLERALVDATRAFELDATNAANASTAARLFILNGQSAQALEIHTAFSGRDSDGWVAYYAAEAAFALQDIETAETILSGALRRLGNDIPAEFRFLHGRILEANGDLHGAAASYRRGLGTSSEHADQWFNLGAIHRRLARDGNDASWEHAIEAFGEAARLASEDPSTWFALGQTYLDHGNFLRAERNLKRAIDQFDSQGITQGRELATAHAGYGMSLLRLAERGNVAGDYQAALQHLEQAEALGVADAALYNNMLAAAIGAQREASDPEQAAAMTRRSEAIMNGPGAEYISSVNLGLAYFNSALNHVESNPETAWREARLATEMLLRESENNNHPHLPALWRYIGHAWALAADSAEYAAAEDGEQASDWIERREEALNNAAAAYRRAGHLRDGIAQRHYLGREADRGPQHAVSAGWQYLKWRTFIAPQAWGVVLTNYGASEIWRRPVHTGVWALLMCLFFIMACKGFFFPGSIASPEPRSASSRERPLDTPSQQRRPQSNQPRRTASRTPAQRRPAATRTPPPQNTAAQGGGNTRRAVDDIARRLANRQGQSDERPRQQPRPPRPRR
ncbi:MAG: tetratricopeptide repeat protein [Planctomycetota bacterium]|nr:MAG: tetratricopeptide repeat protein [Planctomycetota bacterium]